MKGLVNHNAHQGSVMLPVSSHPEAHAVGRVNQPVGDEQNNAYWDQADLRKLRLAGQPQDAGNSDRIGGKVNQPGDGNQVFSFSLGHPVALQQPIPDEMTQNQPTQHIHLLYLTMFVSNI